MDYKRFSIMVVCVCLSLTLITGCIGSGKKIPTPTTIKKIDEPIEKEPINCDQYSDDKEFYNYCISQNALTNGDLETCNKIKGNNEECRVAVSKDTGKNINCNSLSNTQNKLDCVFEKAVKDNKEYENRLVQCKSYNLNKEQVDSCIYEVATRNNRLGFCYRIDGDRLADCVTEITIKSGNFGDCYRDEMNTQQAEECIYKTAIANQELGWCWQINKKYLTDCITGVAVKTGNVGECYRKEFNQQAKDKCIVEVASMNDEMGQCYQINSETLKEECILKIAVNTGRIQDCNRIESSDEKVLECKLQTAVSNKLTNQCFGNGEDFKKQCITEIAKETGKIDDCYRLGKKTNQDECIAEIIK